MYFSVSVHSLLCGVLFPCPCLYHLFSCLWLYTRSKPVAFVRQSIRVVYTTCVSSGILFILANWPPWDIHWAMINGPRDDIRPLRPTPSAGAQGQRAVRLYKKNIWDHVCFRCYVWMMKHWDPSENQSWRMNALVSLVPRAFMVSGLLKRLSS